MKKYLISAVIYIAVSFCLHTGELPEQGGILFEIEIGAASVHYKPETDAALSDLENAGLDRIVVYVGIGAGFSLNNKLYAGAFGF